jgi:hypothetical protein
MIRLRTVTCGPLSELYSRKTPLFVGYAVFIALQLPVGVANDIQTVIISCFLSGACAARPGHGCLLHPLPWAHHRSDCRQFCDFVEPCCVAVDCLDHFDRPVEVCKT